MHKKKFAIVFLVLACCLIVIIFASTKMNATNKDSSDEMIERIENALGDDLKKQSMTQHSNMEMKMEQRRFTIAS